MTRGGGKERGIREERRRGVMEEYVQRTHGQSQGGVGLRVGVGGGGVGESGGRKMETTVLELQ